MARVTSQRSPGPRGEKKGGVILVYCKGGLGNQLFQYAAGRALAARHAAALRFDARWFERPEHHRPLARTFDLPAFCVEGALATETEVAAFAYDRPRRLWSRLKARCVRFVARRKIWHDEAIGYNPAFADLGPDVLLDGYFQHPAYFVPVENELRRELRLRQAPPAAIAAKAAELRAVVSVCLQVRRTDLVLDPARARLHGVCSRDYYRAAWARVRERAPAARGFVFTDDPAWAAEAFRDWPEVSVVGPEWNGPRYLHKFFLMQSCRHFIIANSTWGWWGAWLGATAESVVVMPSRWYADPAANASAVGLRLPDWLAC